MADDHVLTVLLEVFKKGEFSIPEDLVRKVYDIEKVYQFDRDRDLPVEKIKRLIADTVAREVMAKGGRTGAP